EGLVGALLRDQVGELAHLGVVDGVLDAIGDRRVALAHVEAEIQQEPLTDLALGGRHAQVGEQRQATDLDGHLGLGVTLLLVVFLCFVVLGRVFHGALTVAAVTVKASRTGATSWTRNTRAPRSYASTFVAIVAATRSSGSSWPVSRPRNDLREVPITTGRPSSTSSSRRRSSSKLRPTVLPNPTPGSSRIRPSAIPACTANAVRSSRNPLMSPTTSS